MIRIHMSTLLCAGLIGLFSGPVCAGEDGEGAAWLIEPGDLVAGSRVTVTVVFEVGASGIPVGGGLTLGLHHAARWEAIQVRDPEKTGYATVTCETPDNLDVAFYAQRPKGVFPLHSAEHMDIIHRQLVMAKVRKTPLAPGERVTFTLGANEHKLGVFTSTDLDHQFHMSSDTDGDGRYVGIKVQPTVNIIASAPHHLMGLNLSSPIVGVPVKVQVRVEDEFYNVATTYEGKVEIRDESGTILAEDVAINGGIGWAEVTVSAPGPQRFRLRSAELSGRANPCRVVETAPEFSIFWGDLHGHTNISDGLAADADEYFAFGRDVANLDVLAVTDHGHNDWPGTMKAVQKYYKPGSFVTILGEESNVGVDHMNFYYRRDDAPHITKAVAKYNEFYPMLEEIFSEGPEAEVMTAPHHFSYDRGDELYPFGEWDTRWARFIELTSIHGTSEYLNNPRGLWLAKDERKFMSYAVTQGLRFGVIGSSDTHTSHPGRTKEGRYTGGLVAFLAKELTRESIWDSLWNHQVYATGLDRIYMEFTIDDAIVGSEIETSGNCKISYYVIGKTDNVEVFLIRNGEELRVDKTDNGVIEVSFKDTPTSGDNSYYLRVVQDNGENAWSTPIWVTRE